MTTFTTPPKTAIKPAYSKPVNFLQAELDATNSTYKMLMYREGFSHPNTYYSKKKDFAEPDDKQYLMLSMIERFIGRNNCFFRKPDVVNGKTYSPVTMIEFWRIFQDDTQDKLILRMFHPTQNTIPFKLYDYLVHNEVVKRKLLNYYELLRVGKTEAIGGSKARKLVIDEEKDFSWEKMPIDDFAIHLAHLYSKYPSRGRIDIYKDAYMARNYATPNLSPKSPSMNTNVASIATPIQNTVKPTAQPSKNINSVWAMCLEFICMNVPESAFKTWFIPISPIKIEADTLVLKLPSEFFYNWIEENYVDIMRKALDKSLGKQSKLEYIID